MENVTMKEKALIIDDQLENVAGGVDLDEILYTQCGYCRKRVSKIEIVNFNNRATCRECMAKFNKG